MLFSHGLGMNYFSLCLFLICSLVSLSHSRYPYISYDGETLTNHSLLRFDQGHSIRMRCHTDLSSCCNETYGAWKTPLNSSYSDQIHGDMFVDLNGVIDTSGIYECIIPTFSNRQGESVYVGLYPREGTIYHSNCK